LLFLCHGDSWREPRPASSRRRASTTTATSLPTTAAEGNVDHPSAAIVTSSTPTTGASPMLQFNRLSRRYHKMFSRP
jgi:hypothetical protein